MILLSMSVKQIYDQLVEDEPKIQIRIDKVRPKAIKEFKKARSFPTWYIDKYIIPASGNEHIIFYYAGGLSEIEHPRCQYFCVVYEGKQRYTIKMLRMAYKKTPDSDVVMLPQIHSYTHHFLQRYSERFLHNNKLCINEIAGLFFIRNPKPFPMKLNDRINKNFKDYGEYNDLGVLVNDGFCFVRTGIQSNNSREEEDNSEVMLMVYATYLNILDMNESQRIAIEEEEKNVLKRCAEYFG